MLGGGDFASFFLPRGRSFARKAVPGAGILTEKFSGPAVNRGGWGGGGW